MSPFTGHLRSSNRSTFPCGSSPTLSIPKDKVVSVSVVFYVVMQWAGAVHGTVVVKGFEKVGGGANVVNVGTERRQTWC